MFQKVSEVGGDRLVAAMGGAGVSEMVVLFLGHKRLEEPDWATWSQ